MLLVDDDIPTLEELHIHVIEQHAVHWEKLGSYLGLEAYQIDNIAANNDKGDHKVEENITKILKAWLRVIDQPTWGKLDEAIKKLKNKPPLQAYGNDLLGMLNFAIKI